MAIRSSIAALLVLATARGVPAQVVDLPEVRATADAGCVEPAHGTSPALSYACLTRMMTGTPSTPTTALQADPSQRSSNTLGLYNASGLRHRMGPNLGTSVQPYRPKVTYLNPLAR
ncbi:hypothetical protein [Luteibacter yeojuensis]|uniref:Uncharacterized protein n=1 Tax=Luteibacter yeojuensis TaxID=345309 RepID=A0A7X5QT30_9GAMM|nr:hypothetical protein [Luteibacter yeojuensis]NID14920.1 hypothetical protein [Luteibacter yeojuensis]